MNQKQEQKTRIKVKKIGIRGDEVAILFFSLVFLAFLFISFFRLFAVGKLFDDFIFLFLFGWSKYLVYLFLFAIILPILFNYYFRFKLSFIIGIFFTIFMVSWIVQNINILVINQGNNNVWWEQRVYRSDNFINYWNQWWNGTIINNYHGFFAKPISFENWNNINSFFPSYASGGIIANSLVYLTCYGSFIVSWIVSSILLIIGFCWVLFSKPFLLFSFIFIIFKPLTKLIGKKKINHINEGSKKDKIQMNNNKESIKPKKIEEEVAPEINPTVENKFEKKETIKPSKQEQKNKEYVIHEFIQESGSLTPFGRVKKNKTIELVNETEEESN